MPLHRLFLLVLVASCASGTKDESWETQAPERPVCSGDSVWDEGSGSCLCEDGSVADLEGCATGGCELDVDCDDGDPCNGTEACDVSGECVAGEPVTCAEDRVCASDDTVAVCVCATGLTEVDGDCVAACPVPFAPVMGELTHRDVLVFQYEGDGELEVAVGAEDETPSDVTFSSGPEVAVDAWTGPVAVFARPVDDACVVEEIFAHVYQVHPSYSGADGEPGSTGVAMDDPAIVGWATAIADVSFGASLDPTWQVAERALGPATGVASDVGVLGQGGSMTLTFGGAIFDGDGPDFAVFENGFDDQFLEFAYVEVSSDGSEFVRFDVGASGGDPRGPFDLTEPRTVTGVAGKYRGGIGTPFDLAYLRYQPAVQAGRVDLQHITHVRLVDVVGDGDDLDSFGRPIYDPYPTSGSAGFDLDAVGVMHLDVP